MDRRTFISLTGAIGAGVALASVPAITRRPAAEAGMPLTIAEPGMYRISGVVRFDAPTVEISGITNRQTVSWAGLSEVDQRVSTFMSFEHFAQPGLVRTIHVRGGHLESLSAVLIEA
jgi:hypothetical protein